MVSMLYYRYTRDEAQTMITFQLNPRTGCEIYRDGKLIEIVPVKGHVDRLQALGWKPAMGAAFSTKRLRAAPVAR